MFSVSSNLTARLNLPDKTGCQKPKMAAIKAEALITHLVNQIATQVAAPQKHMGVAIEIFLLSSLEANLLVLPFYSPPYWIPDFRLSRAGRFRHNAVDLVNPENIGVSIWYSG